MEKYQDSAHDDCLESKGPVIINDTEDDIGHMFLAQTC